MVTALTSHFDLVPFHIFNDWNKLNNSLSMEWLNANIFFLISAIVLLIIYMLYLAQRKDSNLIKNPPILKKLPMSKYEQAFRELEEFKAKPAPKSRNDQVKRNSEQYYLERELNEILKKTEEEQSSYILTCKECEIAWKDYHDFFDSVPLVQRIFSISKNRELSILRDLYLQTKNKIDIELEKFNARTRVRLHEEKTAHEREQNIEERTIQEKKKLEEAYLPETNETASNDRKKQDFRLPKERSPRPATTNHTIQEAFNEIQLRDDSINDDTLSNKPVPEKSTKTPSAKVAQKAMNHGVRSPKS